MTRVIGGHVGIGPRVTGVALVADDHFSARYDLDRMRGVFSRPLHALFGERYVGRVLVLLGAKGGVATAWMLREMAEALEAHASETPGVARVVSHVLTIDDPRRQAAGNGAQAS